MNKFLNQNEFDKFFEVVEVNNVSAEKGWPIVNTDSLRTFLKCPNCLTYVKTTESGDCQCGGIYVDADYIRCGSSSGNIDENDIDVMLVRLKVDA